MSLSRNRPAFPRRMSLPPRSQADLEAALEQFAAIAEDLKA